MLSRFFRKFVDLSPNLSIVLWKYFYEFIARLFKNMTNWKFMNYGYAGKENTSTDYNILSANLYHHLFGQATINNVTKVLEVGCGRGGGCELLMEYNPASIIGLDFSKNAIKFCQRNYYDPRLKFVVGNAESLPFENNSFDIIVNVESSHGYGNRQNFFKEVVRTLNPSGYFLYADFMSRIYYPKRLIQLQECGLNVLTEQEINKEVVKSMDLSKAYKEAIIKKTIIKPFRKSIADFTGLPGSNIYNNIASGDVIYFSMLCCRMDFKQ